MIPLSFEVLVIIAIVFALIGGRIVLSIAKVFSHFFNPSYYNPGLPVPTSPSDSSNSRGGFGLLIAILLFIVVLFFSWDLWSVILFGNQQNDDHDFKITIPIVYTKSSPNGGIRMEKDEAEVQSDYYFADSRESIATSTDHYENKFECLGYAVQFASGSNIEFVRSKQIALERQYDVKLQIVVGTDKNYKIVLLKTYMDRSDAIAANYHIAEIVYITNCIDIVDVYN